MSNALIRTMRTVLAVAMAVFILAATSAVAQSGAPASGKGGGKSGKSGKSDRGASAVVRKENEKSKAEKDREEEFAAKLAAAATNVVEVKTNAPDEDAMDQAQRLLAAREREQGPQFPGRSPAFLVLPRPAERGNMANTLLTPGVNEMIEKGLAYLASKQDADGGWSDTHFQANTGITGLSCLAFMAEGSRPRIGKYGRKIDNGIEFLLKNVQPSGIIAGKGSNPYGPAYENVFSTLALLFAYGESPRHPELRDVISRSLQAIARGQKLDGGWRYDFGREGLSDMSVTANVLWVLRTARKSGFTVSSNAIDRAVTFIVTCAMPDGNFRYRRDGLISEAGPGGAGIIVLCSNGRIDHPLIPTARNKIAYDYRRYTIQDLAERNYYEFGSFYAGLAMYTCGDEYWIPWYQKAIQVLATMQRKDGEFFDKTDNTVYTTAMALMTLQAPRGYLSIYER